MKKQKNPKTTLEGSEEALKKRLGFVNPADIFKKRTKNLLNLVKILNEEKKYE